MQVAAKPHRHRATPSDPFNDSHTPAYSSYGVPTLTRNAPPQSASHRPPPPPPKSLPKSTSIRRAQPAVPMNMSRDNNVVEAVRDAVQVRSGDRSPRTRMGRSNTEVPAPTRPSTGASRRSHSQDSGIQTTSRDADKNKNGPRSRTKAKKGSSHADVIDRLDFSGVGPMFHHDGPFDACAPSRNKHRTKAPMMAWSAVTEGDKAALAAAHELPRAGDSPYPTSPDVYVPYEAPKKRHDAIAEAWGIHEPEPFEDFSAGGGATRPNGEYPTYSNRNGAGKRTDRSGRSRGEERPDARRQASRRGNLPPPQPIFVPEGEGEVPLEQQEPPSPTGNGTPKRNKSLMRRIRQMRDSPNVPVGGGERDPSPTSSTEENSITTQSAPGHGTRPTHRPQQSFLVNTDKDLPAPPRAQPQRDYFDDPIDGGSPGLGRKTSLMKKMKGVVKGGK
ncbi:uncharacterized protein C8Q71DRAFT_900022 [Rhodofomes roseus]|uniref:Pal1 cell morphology protein n=1 Tax=Rhodofomes roseus TaxID=34475 RepID=A0ABQ8KH81_9APHY|nr:uncharacterized protein C8Q71DRAFT_900022 [Rhodofomes roseus]KAH9837188.1 hypothetical protein C8Q71DRAFT_900022 [Rhodofomes roseus]